MSTDDTPTIDQFRPVVLRVLNDGIERSTKQIHDEVADRMQLSESIRAERLNSGQHRYMNRINWALSALTQGGLIVRPKRGHYTISDDGRTVDKRNLAAYSESDMFEWPKWAAYQEEVAERKRSYRSKIKGQEAPESDNLVETIEAGVEEFNAKVETDLRRALQESSPEFFERAVVDLLWAMGYGGAHGEKQHVGRSGDGGIDGIIRQDALGLSSVYIQAKRYADDNVIQRPAIQQFYGALAEKGTERGVFITTSRFTSGAQRLADDNFHGKIILIDGFRLTSLMLHYGVAVQRAKQLTLYEVDADFFDEGLV
ncbi:restriction endonuclease [Corynebacterium pygosceleis]|uniref:Restriction endonuclease n=1 Tax=Corynebacterium pygosceleis TaxID=2800406 RepID=A0A9Q4GKD4_9CORY|nr:restriction endonuclease [Corynebacterium pygosceleis]MCK7637574.1 restriction endonuclease [Corynebacterium pygosceleis]MCK7674765.1 restriction endonuclease [Corynebacterium pygosceleis]MCL0119646.1 restriction endonuclease [Corynebacterium pygosceleis]MCX7468097.1 restriction endonuclease [Corynebacterium pygosceleis]